jgi:peroxidase
MASNYPLSLFLVPIIGLHLAMGINAEIDPFNIWSHDRSLPTPKQGMDYTFYDDSCPQAEEIVRSRINYFMDQNISQAAGLLRLFHHDCFIKGCDGSVLLRGSAGGPWDLSATPDQSLSPEAFAIIDDIKTNLEAVCPQVVSCADIVALAARDAVLAAKGPYFPIPTGRRDSRALDTAEDIIDSMPKPTLNVSLLLKNFKSRGLDVVDLVALSGAHTIGQAHCASFANRLCPLDPRMSKKLVKNLLQLCPTVESTNKTALDRKSPEKFDHKYYKNLMKNDGLLTSDEDLFYDARTRELVRVFEDSEFAFFLQFAMSAIKMSQLGVLTGMEGEIRVNCWEPNYIEPTPSPAPEPAAFSPSSPAPDMIPISSPTPAESSTLYSLENWLLDVME